MIIVLVGPSGSGKSTLIREYDKLYPRQAVGFITSTTTREPREGDLSVRGSKEYEYVNEDTFSKLASEEKFLKPFEYGDRYGTKLDRLAAPKVWEKDTAYFAILLVEGAEAFLEYAKKHQKLDAIYFFYLSMQSEAERTRRLHERGEKNEKRYRHEIGSWGAKIKNSGLPFIELDVEKFSAQDAAREVFNRVFGSTEVAS